MTNPDNARLLADERTLLEAESNLAREEQKLWQRLESALAGTDGKRQASLASRLSSLEKLADAPPSEVARARALVHDVASAQVLASGERAGALQARRVAVQGRELALKALTTALAQHEAARARQLDELEGLLSSIESGARRAETERQAQEAARRAAQEAAVRAQQAAEEAARLEKAARKTAPELPAVDPLTTQPGVPAFDAMKTTPGMPALDFSPPSSPAVTAAPAPTAAMPAAPAASSKTPAAAQPATKKRLSRRRRVRLAPPPKKLEVEVATYGEDTFYTGWNGSISDGGLFVVSLETLPPGHELDVEIHLEGKTIRSRGRVQFTRRDNLANPDCLSGAGIKLLNLPRDQATTIESFFTQRPPLFFVQP